MIKQNNRIVVVVISEISWNSQGFPVRGLTAGGRRRGARAEDVYTYIYIYIYI